MSRLIRLPGYPGRFILNLRPKIEDDPAQPRHILTVYGEGYRFVG